MRGGGVLESQGEGALHCSGSKCFKNAARTSLVLFFKRLRVQGRLFFASRSVLRRKCKKPHLIKK